MQRAGGVAFVQYANVRRGYRARVTKLAIENRVAQRSPSGAWAAELPVESDNELATLCRACSLCCDGSLFGRVAVAPEEAKSAWRGRLRVLDSGNSFDQPCAALLRERTGERRSCSIYADRPRSCRLFACRIYDRHRREGGPLEPRLVTVERVRQLLARLEASGLTPADFAELTRRVEEDFSRAVADH